MTRLVDIPAAASELPPNTSIGAELGVRATEYTTVANSRIKIEWTRDGDDYVYQWRPIQASPLDEREIIARLINVLADYVPRDVDVNIDIPIPDMGVLFFTIRVNKVAERPGAERMCEDRILAALGQIDVWAPAVA